MNPVRFAVERPVAVVVIAVLVVLAGLMSLASAPVQLTPEIEPTFVSVTTFWDGASPAEVESEILIEQEEKLRGVANLVKMSSIARQNEGVIRLEFKVGADKNEALREVSDKLREVPDYPENVDEPVVEAGDFASRDYIAWIIVRCPDDSYDVRDSYDFYKDRVQPFLERVPGVSRVNILGGREREVQVRVDSGAMSARGVTYGQLIGALRAENVDASGGQVPEGKRDIRLRVVGKFDDPRLVGDTVVTVDAQGAPVRVRDIAEVELTFAEAQSVVRSKGATVLAINAQREVGSNVLQVMQGLKAQIAELNAPGGMLDQESRRLGHSAPMHLDMVYDQTIYIYNALDLVTSNIFVGGALAIACLLVFLRSVRATFIVAATIPVSIIGSFIVLPAFGRNINVISLAGMAFAVGMVVDNAIVVLENIYRRRQLGEPALRAALNGAGEVWVAIAVSTLTTVVVFIPILTIQEEVGQLFRDIALAICAAVLLSLGAAVIIIPPFAARLFRKGFEAPARRTRRGPATRLVAFFSRLRDLFASALHFALGSWAIRLAVVGVVGSAALVGIAVLAPPATYLPAGNRNLVFGFLIPPPGYNLDTQIDLGKRIESTLQPYWEARAGTPEADALPMVNSFDYATGAVTQVRPPPIENFFFVSFGGGMFMGATSQIETVVRPLVPLLQTAASPAALPGVWAIPFQTPLFQTGGFGSSNSIDLEISGDDLAAVRSAAGALMGKGFELAGQGVFDSVRPDPGNFNIAAQEVQLKVDPFRAAMAGVTVADIATAIRVMGDGAIIDDYRFGGENIDIRVIDRRQADYQAPELGLGQLEAVPIPTPASGAVNVGSIAEVRRVDSPQQINRIEGRRSVTLTIAAPVGVPLESAMNAVRNDMIEPFRAAGVIAPDIQTNLAGAADKLTQVRRAMLGDWSGGFVGTVKALLTSRLFLALLCCYLLMCALFESFIYPLVILISVPLAMVGGMAGLRIVHWFDPTQQLDTLTMLGFVILIGVVVNNAILLVAQALNFMRGFGESEQDIVERMPPRKAIVESARTRLRPILMTTMTSVLGMAPLVVAPGAGSELYRGLGSVVLSGLIFSTVFTLVLCPMLMSMAIDFRLLIAKILRQDWDPGAFERITDAAKEADRSGPKPVAASVPADGRRQRERAGVS